MSTLREKGHVRGNAKEQNPGGNSTFKISAWIWFGFRMYRRKLQMMPSFISVYWDKLLKNTSCSGVCSGIWHLSSTLQHCKVLCECYLPVRKCRHPSLVCTEGRQVLTIHQQETRCKNLSKMKVCQKFLFELNKARNCHCKLSTS